MSTYIFGGNNVQPAQVSYASYTNFSSPLQLTWPIGFVDSTTTQAVTMEFATTSVGSAVYLGDATQIGVGTSFIVINRGTQSITFSTYGGGVPLFTLAPSIARWVYLKDGSTQEGDWGNIVYGAGTSSADVEALAGFGLIALPVGLPTTLNTQYGVISVTTTNYAVSATDRAALLVCSGVSTVVTLPASTLDGFFFLITNQTTSFISLQAPVGGTINGETEIAIDSSFGAVVVSDGNNNFYTVGLETSAAAVVTQAEIAIPTGATTVELTAEQLSRNILYVTGILTANCTIYFGTANAPDQWTIQNATSGNFTISVQMGTPATPVGNIILIPQGSAGDVFSNAASTTLVRVSDVAYPITTAGVPLLSEINLGPSYTGKSILGIFQDYIDSPVSFNNTQPFVTILAGSAQYPAGFQSNNNFVCIQGCIALGPSHTNGAVTTITIQRNGVNLPNQGSKPIVSIPYTDVGSTNVLLSIPFYVIDTITDNALYIYTINGSVTGATTTSYANRNVSNTVDGVSYISVTAYGGF